MRLFTLEKLVLMLPPCLPTRGFAEVSWLRCNVSVPQFRVLESALGLVHSWYSVACKHTSPYTLLANAVLRKGTH